MTRRRGCTGRSFRSLYQRLPLTSRLAATEYPLASQPICCHERLDCKGCSHESS